MKTVEKKIWPEYFEEVLAGDKTFEVRLNDFEIEKGDTLLLREWNPKTKSYTGRELKKKVGYVGKWKVGDLEKFWSREEIDNKGFQIISLKGD